MWSDSAGLKKPWLGLGHVCLSGWDPQTARWEGQRPGTGRVPGEPATLPDDPERRPGDGGLKSTLSVRSVCPSVGLTFVSSFLPVHLQPGSKEKSPQTADTHEPGSSWICCFVTDAFGSSTAENASGGVQTKEHKNLWTLKWIQTGLTQTFRSPPNCVLNVAFMKWTSALWAVCRTMKTCVQKEKQQPLWPNSERIHPSAAERFSPYQIKRLRKRVFVRACGDFWMCSFTRQKQVFVQTLDI